MGRTALKLFPSEEDALEFLEDCDLDEARFKLLMELGRVLEAAGIHAKNGNLLKAVELLTAAPRADHVRPVIEYLLTGLLQNMTFGVLPDSNPTAQKLLVYTDRLDKSAMTEQEITKVCLSNPFDRCVLLLHPNASSSPCSKQSGVLTVRG